jgi:PAS domain S-box-containing protein
MDISSKLLVVDPHPASRAAKVRLLKDACLRVSVADSARAALQSLDAEVFDLVVVNADANAEDPTIYEAIKERSPSTPILCIARTNDATISDSAIDGFLLDPFAPAELIILVRSLLHLNRCKLALRDAETRLQLVEDAGALAVVDYDLVTRRALWSDKFAELFQLPPEASEKRFGIAAILNVVQQDDRASLLADYQRLLRDSGQFERDFRITRPDGAVGWINARGSFIRGAAGRVERILCLCIDITERKQAGSRNAQLAAIVASSIDAIVSVDRADTVRTWNYGAEQLFGYAAEEVIGRDARFFVPPNLFEERTSIFARLMSGEAVEYQTQRRHKNGQSIDVWIRGAPVRDADGDIFGCSLIIRDITAQKQREEHVRFLMRELTHRSKNLLAVIQAMARQSLSALTTPEEFVVRFTERLSGLAGSHDLLSSDDWAGASLVQLIRSQLQHYDDLFDTRIRLEGSDLILRPEAAQNIGIALHELSTNAAKFGALSVEGGTVTVSWTIVTDENSLRRMHLRWKERSGPPVVLPVHKGFGRMVMDRIAGQALGGRSTSIFAPDGVCWELDVPAAAVVREQAGVETVHG